MFLYSASSASLLALSYVALGDNAVYSRRFSNGSSFCLIRSDLLAVSLLAVDTGLLPVKHSRLRMV